MAAVVPRLDHAKAEHARLVNVARAALVGSAGSVTFAMFANATWSPAVEQVPVGLRPRTLASPTQAATMA